MNGVGKIGANRCRKMRLDHLLIPHTRINSKWIKDLNIRPKTIKILEENIDSKSWTLLVTTFYRTYLPRQGKQTKNTKWDRIKQKRFCTAKENINKIKRQPTE